MTCIDITYMGEPVGYVEYPTELKSYDDAEKCFDLCNWSHWADEKPKELYSDVCSVSHGICFRNPSGTNYLALSQGWLMGDDKKIADYIETHKERSIWL